jgi:hypothetical protein
VALVDSMSPHLSTVDVLPLKRKELRAYILVSPVSTLRLFLSLTCILLVTCLLACLSLIGNSLSCTSSEFTLCQALKLKKIKNWLSAYSPPPVACIDPFNWYHSKGSLIGLYRLRDYGRRGAHHKDFCRLSSCCWLKVKKPSNSWFQRPRSP